MKYLIVIAFAIFGLAQASVEYDSPCRTEELSPRVKSAFQVTAYLGTWYETSRYEAVNQTGFDCTMARYTLNVDGSVQVANSGYTPAGNFIEFIGRADVAFPESNPLVAKLNVVFAPGQPPAIYWVMSTDYVNYAVVWSCTNLAANNSREQLWILSRTPELTGTASTRVQQVLDQNAFKRDALRPTSQDLGQCRGGTGV